MVLRGVLVTVTSSDTTFLTLARVPTALGAWQRAHIALLPLLFQHHYPFPLSIFTPVLPPFFFCISLFLSFFLSLPPHSDLGWDTNNARVRTKSTSRIVVPQVVPPVVRRNYLTMINEA